MNPPQTKREPLTAAVAGIVTGAFLGWLIAVWIWLARIPGSGIPTAHSPENAEYLATRLCVCAIPIMFCRKWDTPSRIRLAASLIGGYALGLVAAPLQDESLDSELARIWTYVIFEFHPSWGLAGAMIGGTLFCLYRITRRGP